MKIKEAIENPYNETNNLYELSVDGSLLEMLLEIERVLDEDIDKETGKAKLDQEDVWYVHLEIPREFVQDVKPSELADVIQTQQAPAPDQAPAEAPAMEVAPPAEPAPELGA